jgi:hypothetical protein
MSTKAIASQLNLGQDPAAARAWVLEDLGPVLAHVGFKPAAARDANIEFTRRSLPGWALLLGIVTLPFGLLVLALVRRTDVLVVDLSVQAGTVIATASGSGPAKVKELLEKLNREGVAMRVAAAPPPPTIAAQEE